MEATRNNKTAGIIQLSLKIISYNLKIVFGGKFSYFLLAAMVIFFYIIIDSLFGNYHQGTAEIYNIIILPALLTVFYPVIYNIQNDKDARMLEIIFSIPNYRYKIYLVRFIISFLLMMVAVLFMASFSWFSVVRIPILQLVYQLFFPLFFLSCLAFLFTTLTYNGNTAAVLVLIVGLIFFVLQKPMEGSKWFIFLNPFEAPKDTGPIVWQLIVKQNRTILLVGSAICLLWALIKLQKREKFI